MVVDEADLVMVVDEVDLVMEEEEAANTAMVFPAEVSPETDRVDFRLAVLVAHLEEGTQADQAFLQSLRRNFRSFFRLQRKVRGRNLPVVSLSLSVFLFALFFRTFLELF